MDPKSFTMQSKVWIYPSMAGWHFITLPKKESDLIKEIFGVHSRGFGSLPINITIGKTTWKTSIFPDKKESAYVLPLKAEVRKKENIKEGDKITFQIIINI